MSYAQHLENQAFLGTLIYPFVILVLAVFHMAISDQYLDNLPKDENPTSGETGTKDASKLESETQPDNEPVLVTVLDSHEKIPSQEPTQAKKEDGVVKQDAPTRDVGHRNEAAKQTTKYPPVLIGGIVIQTLQLYFFYQISSIATGLVQATNKLAYKVMCGGIGLGFSTCFFMMSAGRLMSVYASAQAGRRAELDGKWPGGFYGIFSAISAIVIVYSWGKLAWA
ncbi:hypothetical protein LTR84_001527 [Exophiala bonariae]|uniref:Uncharacterized protein n=1 Tax=Exophiala bonariae TaxID=1690606 RepID=A0AAV9NCX9_9EURO|nr:hypothetical protein LTR84_001527 [Exophiala bonariae]